MRNQLKFMTSILNKIHNILEFINLKVFFMFHLLRQNT